jgi:ferredoxin
VKVWVDSQRCQGHTLCAMAAPDAFALDDIDGHATAVFEDGVPADQEAAVREASLSCPERAIAIEQDAKSEGAAS